MKTRRTYSEEEMNEIVSIAVETGDSIENIIDVMEGLGDLIEEGVVIETDFCRCESVKNTKKITAK